MKKVVFITGVSAGIGLAVAKAFLASGDTVYGVSRRSFDYPGLCHICADVTCEAEIKAAVAEVIHKEKRIDILVNNAGMGISGSVENTSAEQMQKIFAVNNFGAVFALQAVIPIMREVGGGTIINIASVASVIPVPFQSFYVATKSSLLMLSDSLRMELKPFNIKVCSILPGDVKTNFTAAREKNPTDDAAYGERIHKSVAVMEKDEQNGLSPNEIAKKALWLSYKKNPPPRTVVGKKYQLVVVLAKFLPIRIVYYLIDKLYAF